MTTPDNAIYYKLAYTVAAIIYLGYALSIMLRRRRLLARVHSLTTAASER